MDDLAKICVGLASIGTDMELCRLAAREAVRSVAEMHLPAEDAISFIEPVLDTLAHLCNDTLQLQDSALDVGRRLHDRVCPA